MSGGSGRKAASHLARWAHICVRMRKRYPSLRAIAKKAGLSDRALRNAMRRVGESRG